MAVRRRLAFVITVCLLASREMVVAGQDATRAKEAYTRAIELETQGNNPAALSLLWEAAGLAPRDADIQNRLGEALERIGALDAAVAAYRLAVTERPAFRKASNNLILALVKAGQGKEAVALARALVAQAPDDPDRHFTLGLAQSEQDVTDAIQSFRRVLTARAPSHPCALQPRARAQAHGSSAGRARRTGSRAGDRAAPGGVLHLRRYLLAPGRSQSGRERTPRRDRG